MRNDLYGPLLCQHSNSSALHACISISAMESVIMLVESCTTRRMHAAAVNLVHVDDYACEQCYYTCI